MLEIKNIWLSYAVLQYSILLITFILLETEKF